MLATVFERAIAGLGLSPSAAAVVAERLASRNIDAALAEVDTESTRAHDAAVAQAGPLAFQAQQAEQRLADIRTRRAAVVTEAEAALAAARALDAEEEQELRTAIFSAEAQLAKARKVAESTMPRAVRALVEDGAAHLEALQRTSDSDDAEVSERRAARVQRGRVALGELARRVNALVLRPVSEIEAALPELRDLAAAVKR